MCSAVVDTAARYDHNVAVIADKKVVIDRLLDSRVRNDHGDMNALVLCTGLDVDVDTRHTFLGDDIDVVGRISSGKLAVYSKVVCALGNIGDVGDLSHHCALDLV